MENAFFPGVAGDKALPAAGTGDVVGLHPEGDRHALELAEVAQCDVVVLPVERQRPADDALGWGGPGDLPVMAAGGAVSCDWCGRVVEGPMADQPSEARHFRRGEGAAVDRRRIHRADQAAVAVVAPTDRRPLAGWRRQLQLPDATAAADRGSVRPTDTRAVRG